jgi:hypothetical protein
MPPSPRQRSAVLDKILKQMAVLAEDTSSSDNLKAFACGLFKQIDCSPLEWIRTVATLPWAESYGYLISVYSCRIIRTRESVLRCKTDLFMGLVKAHLSKH